MSAKNQDTVTLGADVGGQDASAATNEHMLALRKLLRQECQGPYSDTIKEFALVLRIDGAVQTWGKRGVENVALRIKSGYVTADIFVPKDMWSGGNSTIFRNYLAAEVRNAIVKITERAQERKVTLSFDKLSHDIEAAIKKFLV